MMRMIASLIVVCLPVFAQASEKIASPAFSWLSVLNMLFGLAVVLALIYGLQWVLKKYGRLPGVNQADMKILGGISLGTREKAVLVQVEGQKILLGVAPGRVSLLHQFDSKPFAQALSSALDQKS